MKRYLMSGLIIALSTLTMASAAKAGQTSLQDLVMASATPTGQTSLQDLAADLNGDGVVTIQELHVYNLDQRQA